MFVFTFFFISLLFRYCGYQLVAAARIPINCDTLCFGSDDAGKRQKQKEKEREKEREREKRKEKKTKINEFIFVLAQTIHTSNVVVNDLMKEIGTELNLTPHTFLNHPGQVKKEEKKERKRKKFKINSIFFLSFFRLFMDQSIWKGMLV